MKAFPHHETPKKHVWGLSLVSMSLFPPKHTETKDIPFVSRKYMATVNTTMQTTTAKEDRCPPAPVERSSSAPTRPPNKCQLHTPG